MTRIDERNYSCVTHYYVRRTHGVYWRLFGVPLGVPRFPWSQDKTSPMPCMVS